MATTIKEAKAVEPKANEMVKVKLPLTREKQDAVFVSLNGNNFQIQRGVEVEVPKGVYEILKNSEEMDSLALQMSIKLQKDNL